jgi:hypothetical protein
MFDQMRSRLSRPPAALSTTSIVLSIKAFFAPGVASAISGSFSSTKAASPALRATVAFGYGGRDRHGSLLVLNFGDN